MAVPPRVPRKSESEVHCVPVSPPLHSPTSPTPAHPPLIRPMLRIHSAATHEPLGGSWILLLAARVGDDGLATPSLAARSGGRRNASWRRGVWAVGVLAFGFRFLAV